MLYQCLVRLLLGQNLGVQDNTFLVAPYLKLVVLDPPRELEVVPFLSLFLEQMHSLEIWKHFICSFKQLGSLWNACYVHQSVSSFEQLPHFAKFDVNNGLSKYLRMHWLHINTLVSNIYETVYTDERHYVFNL